MRPAAPAAVFAFAPAALLVACGSLGGGGGGGDGLPNRGIAGYTMVRVEGSGEGSAVDAADLPPEYIHSNADDRPRLVEPSAWLHDGAIEMLAERRERDDSAIVWLRSTDGGSTFSEPVDLLVPAALPAEWGAWEELSAPALLRTSVGWVVAVGVGDGEGIGLLRGAALDALVPDPALALVPTEAFELEGIGAPSLVSDGDVLLLYYQTAGTNGVEGSGAVDYSAAIALARIEPDGAVVREGVVVDASVCGDAEECLEAEGIGSPEVRLATTAAGRAVYRLFASAGDDGTDAIVFAASFDGRAFSRFPFNPVIDEARFAEYGATNLRIDDTYVLIYTREPSRGTRGIVRAINAIGDAADRF